MTISDALAITQRTTESGDPVPFSVEFVTCNRTNANVPSRHVRWKHAVRCGASHNLKKHDQIGIKPVDGSHAQVAVHLRLILRINGEIVS